MAPTGRRYPVDEMKRRADAIFEEIRTKLKKANKRHFLAIEIETGAYEIDASEMEASRRLHARIPDAQILMRRVGSRYARHYGGRRSRAARS